MTNATKRRAQDRRSDEIRRAALALSQEVKQFTAGELAFRMTGVYPKQNGRAGNPTPGYSKCLSAMVREGYLVALYSPAKAPRIYGAAKDGEAVAPRLPAVPPKAENEPFIRTLTPQERMQGRARPARARRVNLEEPLWQEDLAR